MNLFSLSLVDRSRRRMAAMQAVELTDQEVAEVSGGNGATAASSGMWTVVVTPNGDGYTQWDCGDK